MQKLSIHLLVILLIAGCEKNNQEEENKAESILTIKNENSHLQQADSKDLNIKLLKPDIEEGIYNTHKEQCPQDNTLLDGRELPFTQSIIVHYGSFSFFEDDMTRSIKDLADMKLPMCWNGKDTYEDYYSTIDSEVYGYTSIIRNHSVQINWDNLHKNLEEYHKNFNMTPEFASNMLGFLFPLYKTSIKDVYLYFKSKDLISPTVLKDIAQNFDLSLDMEEPPQEYQEVLLDMLDDPKNEFSVEDTKVMSMLVYLYAPIKNLEGIQILFNTIAQKRNISLEEIYTSTLTDIVPTNVNHHRSNYGDMQEEFNNFNDVHRVDLYTDTPTHNISLSSIYASDPQILQILQDKNVLDLKANSDGNPFFFYSFLYFANEYKKENIYAQQEKLEDFLDKQDLKWNAQNDQDENVLLFTVHYGDIDTQILNYFEKHGIDFTQQDKEDNNVLHLCFTMQSTINYNSYFSAYEQDGFTTDNEQGERGKKILAFPEMLFAPCHNREVFEWIAKKYPDLLTQKNKEGKTPLDFISQEYKTYLKNQKIA